MVYISEKQKLAMDLVDGLVRIFGKDRWFTRCELPGITLHSMDALVLKYYLDRKNAFGVVYYRRLKELGDES